MAYYVRYYSELPQTASISRRAKKGELRKFDSIVDARRYGVNITANGGVALVYSKNVDNYLYAVNSPLAIPDFVGYVFRHIGTDQYYFAVRDHVDRTGHTYFAARPIYKNGKLEGRS